MGWNTVVVVMNDALHDIAGDTQFGERLQRAVLGFSTSRRLGRDSCVAAHGERCVHVNAAEVVSQDHADGHQVVIAHGNTGWALTADPNDGVPDAAIKHLEWLLKQRRASKRAEMKTESA